MKQDTKKVSFYGETPGQRFYRDCWFPFCYWLKTPEYRKYRSEQENSWRTKLFLLKIALSKLK